MLQHLPWTPYSRRALMRMLPRDSLGAEVGVHRGDFAADILTNANPKLLYLVDTWPKGKIISNGSDMIDGLEAKHFVEQRFRDEIEAGVVKLLHCSSLDLDGRIRLGSLDWIYLDTFHQYPKTLHELRALVKFLKPDGFMLGHDYTMRGVKRAVDEFIEESEYSLIAITMTDRQLSFGCCITANQQTSIFS